MSTAAGVKTPAQLFGLVFGIVYLALGLIGFAFLGGEKEIFGIFSISVVHNVVHLGVGALLLYGSRTLASAKMMNMVVGIVYLLVAILGFANIFVSDSLVNANDADDYLHIATAVLALYFGTAGAGAPETV